MGGLSVLSDLGEVYQVTFRAINPDACIEQVFAGPGNVADGLIERREIVQIFICNFNQGPVCAGERQ